MKINLFDSACNILKGTIKRVSLDGEESEVILEIAPGVEITSVVPRNIAQKLHMVEGEEAFFTIDASDVLIALD
ncbi:molybdopterin-binding protein [Scytonema sp. NUACC26]|uniref:TOBE domain-containing protein n=1 Tax=Scytonema sp. NUACC26 TaxID=3140176 RepID=UPI0034DCAA08